MSKVLDRPAQRRGLFHPAQRRGLLRLKSWWTVFQRETLKRKTWGRQAPAVPPATEQSPSVGGIDVKMRGKASIKARVWRVATGQWEDLGEVYKE